MSVRESHHNRPARVLVVSSSGKDTESITSLIKSVNIADINYAESVVGTRSFLSSSEFDIIIINAPLDVEVGDKLAIDITKQNGRAVIILLVKDEDYDELSKKLNPYGILILSKPITERLFVQTLNIAVSIYAKIKSIRNETDTLRTKIDDMKIIDRAKLILMQYIGMPENQAHRYIEKQAMDLRITKREAAENILKTYEQ